MKGFVLTLVMALAWPLGAAAQVTQPDVATPKLETEAPKMVPGDGEIVQIEITKDGPTGPKFVTVPQLETKADAGGEVAPVDTPVTDAAVAPEPETGDSPDPAEADGGLETAVAPTSASDMDELAQEPSVNAGSEPEAMDAEPEAEAAPEPLPTDPAPAPEAAAAPEPEMAAEPVAEPEQAEPEPTAEPVPDPMSPEPEPVAEPVVTPEPEPAPEVAEPAPAPTPEPDPNIAACLDTAGPATAGVPANKAAAAAQRAALIAAITPCTEAAQAEDAPAEVLFLAAEIAQGRRDLAAAFALLERAADMGFGPAETRLGDYYLFGAAPGGEDPAAAIARYRAATALDDPAGMTTLALMHRVGKGVPRDPTRMVTLLQAAADAGYHFAQYRLAQTYLNGDGIPGRRDDTLGIPDPAKAAALYTKAAEAGNITAALELAALYADPASGLDENPAEQARLTLMASRAGLPAATAAMGVLYETGRGVPRDPEVAARLYVRALESGEVAFEALRSGAPGGWDRDTALAFQKILQDRGLYTGALDGVIGPGSTAGARSLAGN